jgi:hypothetical protein
VLPDDIQQFLRQSVRSVWTLDLLLLLRRGGAWRPDALIRELRASPKVVAESLGELALTGLVGENGQGAVHYRAGSPLDPLVGRLEAVYHERPVAVTEAILGGATAKIQTFADSFKFRKD